MDEKRNADVGRVPVGWREENLYRLRAESAAGQMAVPEPPTLFMRVEALHRLLDGIEMILGGDDTGAEQKQPGPPTSSKVEDTVGGIGEGLGEVFSRLEKLRERLTRHMKVLR